MILFSLTEEDKPINSNLFLHCKYVAQKLGQAFPIVSGVFANPRRKCFRFVVCRSAETLYALVNQTSFAF